MNMKFNLPDNLKLLHQMQRLDQSSTSHYGTDSDSAGALRATGALRDVSTVWLARDCHPHTGVKMTLPFRHPSMTFLQEAANVLGITVADIHFSYYIILPPAGVVYPHVDTAPYYSSVNRYLLFFDLTADNVMTQTGNESSSNSLVLFDPSVLHSFNNLSVTEPWGFVVLDVYKGIPTA